MTLLQCEPITIHSSNKIIMTNTYADYGGRYLENWSNKELSMAPANKEIVISLQSRSFMLKK